jgi:hypothetical protein
MDFSRYSIFEIVYKDKICPVVVDSKYYNKIMSISNNWKIINGQVATKIINNEESYDIYLHELIMNLKNKKIIKKAIIHINKICLDNRENNLMYDICNKDIQKNIKKKKRNVILPSTTIDADKLPTYVWYSKGDDKHGDKFIVKIGDLVYNTTSSKKVSLDYKLEEAKKYLRKLKEENPKLFCEYSMNGDYTDLGIKLSNEFNTIITKAGYKLNFKISESTDSLLKENLTHLTYFEKKLLKYKSD